MNQYLISVYQPDGGVPEPAILEPIMRDVEAVNAELREAGAWVFAGGLFPPSTATVLRLKDSEVLTTDGPYVEGKEHLGGFTVIRAADLDEALAWGAKVARAITLPVEVRPLQSGTCR
ncbi:YciI family protein [Streptomyces sp. NPDC050439]|uniref:YciI family protein n=1 Tax=unclassified Streptomyces TaxID=2593676 RepID=UPI0034161157